MWAAAGLVAIALAVLGASLVYHGVTVGQDAAERHLDGEGPLGSVGDPSTSLSGAFDQNAPASRWTLGVPLCLDQGNDPAVLDGTISGTQVIGDGFTYLGAFVREFTPAQGDTPIGGVEGFPPNVKEPLHNLKGYAVSNRCQSPGHREPSAPYTAHLLGCARLSDNHGRCVLCESEPVA